MAQPIEVTKIEGSPYLYKAVYKSGATRYLARVARGGKNIKRYFPFTEKGKSAALSEIDTFLTNLDPQDLKKADAVIKKLKNPPNPLRKPLLIEIQETPFLSNPTA